MNVLIIIYLLIYGSAVGGVVFAGFFLHLKRSKRKNDGTTLSADDITLLIPFRNERERLETLLSSILNAKKLPRRIVFIDDHSNDGSAEFINERLGILPHEVLQISDEQSGKKAALRAAITVCETKYILTFDADVSFRPEYFDSIELLEEADMYVLPAILCGNSPLEKLYELDVVLANALNAGLSGVARPIFSSGANFLFNRQVFDEVDDLESHAHMASGDDTYLLRDFRLSKKDVRLESSLSVAVYTDTPHSFKEFIDQRLRWVGKTTDIGDPLASTSAIGQFIFAIVFFVLLFFALFTKSWSAFTFLISIKIGMDLLFFLPFFHRTNRILTWCLIPIYELIFPIYSLIIGILMLTYRPKWKGREIDHRRS